jgi:hypothetical protein
MPELQDARRLLELAEHAANAGDLRSADELLRNAARLQETELGPLHTELANTLNNLAIVAEKSGRLDDAEGFYRRAVAIASAALPADHPMVVASRQNLEDFCHASGLPVDGAAVLTPTTHDTELGLAAFADESTDHTAEHAEDPDLIGPRTPPAPAPASAPPATPTAQPSRSPFLWIVYTAVAVGTAVLLILWQVSPDSSVPASTVASAPPPAATTPAAPAAPEASATTPTASSPAPDSPAGTAPAVADQPREATLAPSATSSDGVSLAAVELCRSFSTAGGAWRCDPADDSPAPGPLVLFTRVKSPRGTTIVHRWSRDDTPQLSAKLPIRANPSEGYRTYSRRAVASGEAWHVEVRTASGELLHERRFVVR